MIVVRETISSCPTPLRNNHTVADFTPEAALEALQEEHETLLTKCAAIEQELASAKVRITKPKSSLFHD